jgi:nucleotide sugar dehydrogenase
VDSRTNKQGKFMNVGILGVGKLGLVYALAFERHGLYVYASSYKQEYVDSLQQKNVDNITEPEIAKLLTSAKNIKFTVDNQEVIQNCDIMYVMVATPSLPDGSYDTSAVYEVANDLINHPKSVDDKILVVGSTVNPGDCDKLQQLLEQYGVHVVYSPTMAAQGTVLKDIESPIALLLGTDNDQVAKRCKKVFTKIIDKNTPVYQVSLTTAEILKIAANCLGTLRINYFNTIGQILINSNQEQHIPIANKYLSDTGIKKGNSKFGFGYGGPCFPRDNRAFANYTSSIGITNYFAELNDKLNKQHIEFLTNYFISSNKDKKDFYFPYVSYKPGVRIFEESHQLAVCQNLLDTGATVYIEPTEFLDEDIKKELKNKWKNQVHFEKLATLEARNHSLFKINL